MGNHVGSATQTLAEPLPHRKRRTFAELASLVSLAVLLLPAIATGQIDNADCFSCHDDPDMEAETLAGETISAYIDPLVYAASVHGDEACTSCHLDIDDPDHADVLARVDCAECHSDVVETYAASDHGIDRDASQRGAAACADCHGSPHGMLPASDKTSPVHALLQAKTCGACHLDNPGSHLSVQGPVTSYAATVHGQALLEQGNEEAASCTDCHGVHSLNSSSNPVSQVYRSNVPATCGQCHDGERGEFDRSVHGTALADGILDAPVCTDCHGEHSILDHSNPASKVFATTVSRTTCPQCHEATRITEKFGIETNRQQSYMASYHGLASQLGVVSVANCASCHGVHDILPSTDPLSKIHPDNLGNTCGSCHPGASTTMLASVKVHSNGPGLASQEPGAIVKAIYVVLITVVIGGMLLHHGVDLVRKMVAHLRRERARKHGPLRWSSYERAEHVVLLVSFIALAYSGFVIRFPMAWWAEPFHAIGGEAFRRGFHRAFAIVFVALSLLHIVHVLFSPRGRRFLSGMVPRAEDVRVFLRFVTGRMPTVPEPHEPGRFSYIAKAEYWALAWGSWVMILTGAVLVFNNWSLANLRPWVLDVSTEIHYWEALLASLAIVVWHFYRVIFDPLVYPLDAALMTGRGPESGDGPPPPARKQNDRSPAAQEDGVLVDTG